MVITRSYWLGLGSGLIISALLISIFNPYLNQKQYATTKVQSSVPSVKQENIPAVSIARDPKEADIPTNQQTQNVVTDGQYQRDFVVPDGASAGQIANLLVSQGFIKDKADFLAVVQQMGVESKFSSGKFTLAFGLTTEEMVNRLIEK